MGYYVSIINKIHEFFVCILITLYTNATGKIFFSLKTIYEIQKAIPGKIYMWWYDQILQSDICIGNI